MRRVRETSKEAYKRLVEGGYLTPKRAEVYCWLKDHGEATAREVERGLRDKNAQKRLSELRKQDMVKELPNRRPCKVTGNRVILWDITTRFKPLPLPRTRGKSKGNPHIHVVRKCEECPLVAAEPDGSEICWMRVSIKIPKSGRPVTCPLVAQDFVIRGA